MATKGTPRRAAKPAPHNHHHHLSARGGGAAWAEREGGAEGGIEGSATLAGSPGCPTTPPAAAAPPRATRGLSDAAGAPAGGEEYSAAADRALAAIVAEACRAGEAFVEVGAPCGAAQLGPGGLPAPALDALVAALAARAAAAAPAPCVATEVQRRPADGGAVADVCVRRAPGPGAPPVEVRVAVAGNVDSGKSTLVGVLTRAALDDGRGAARARVFRHGHEAATGRTSSVGQHALCLDAAGRALNDERVTAANTDRYVAGAAKVVTLVDLAGHEKYFRTTAYGLTAHAPDYACVVVGANAGLVGMAREHLGVALALHLPSFFVVTKVDLAPAHVAKASLDGLAALLRRPGVRRRPFVVRGVGDAVAAARAAAADAVAPIFVTSCVTGDGLELVRLFLSLLPARADWAERAEQPTRFAIDETFAVPGVGAVVAGTVLAGAVAPGQALLLGPDPGDGAFRPAVVRSVHYKRLPVPRAVAGQTASLALKRAPSARGGGAARALAPGMALVAPGLAPAAGFEFDAEVAVLTHSTTIRAVDGRSRYQAVIHCGAVRQSAQLVAIADAERLRSGDRARVRFRFMQRPEYVLPGARFVFREGRTKGVGTVVAAGAALPAWPAAPPAALPAAG